MRPVAHELLLLLSIIDLYLYTEPSHGGGIVFPQDCVLYTHLQDWYSSPKDTSFQKESKPYFLCIHCMCCDDASTMDQV